MKEREEIYKGDKKMRQRKWYHNRSGGSWYGHDQETIVKKTMIGEVEG